MHTIAAILAIVIVAHVITGRRLTARKPGLAKQIGAVNILFGAVLGGMVTNFALIALYPHWDGANPLLALLGLILLPTPSLVAIFALYRVHFAVISSPAPKTVAAA